MEMVLVVPVVIQSAQASGGLDRAVVAREVVQKAAQVLVPVPMLAAQVAIISQERAGVPAVETVRARALRALAAAEVAAAERMALTA